MSQNKHATVAPLFYAVANNRVQKSYEQQIYSTSFALVTSENLSRITDQYTTTITCLTVTCIVLNEFLLLLRFLKEVTNAVCDKTIDQHSTQTVRDNVLITQGPVVSYWSFKHGKRSARAIAESEFNPATESLMQDGFGRIVENRISRARSTCKVFVKRKPHPWPNCTNVSVNEFDNALAKPLHNDITVPMRQYLQANNYISN